jgi:two-component system phosphate regulon sensor histidine kinase PhoR
VVRAILLPLALALGLLLGWSFAQSRQRPAGRDQKGSRQWLRWLEAAPSGWLIVAADDRVRLLNPRAERLLQLGTAIPSPVFLEQICADAQLREVIHAARRHQRPQRLEWELGGEELEAIALPGDGGWVGVQLQSRRSIEAQLDQQERWVSDVAHELRTPLTALLLVGDSLSAQVTSGNAVLVERLQRELRRLQALVVDLLELSRLQNSLPGQGMALQPVDLAPLVERVWAGLRPLAEARSIGLCLHQPMQDAPAAVVVGDESRLHRALLNLLDNALRYSPDGGKVEVRLTRGRHWCRLEVQDQGPGFSEADLEHMFERFYRGDPSRMRSGRTGSGLGLSIVQQIALTHGGRVQADNHPRGGALIELLLPLAH